MTKRLKAIINPAVLEWARKCASYTLEAAAAKVGVETEVLHGWEKGEDQPSIPQLRKLAEAYKRPLAVMYLPEPPLTFSPLHDFRRLPDTGTRNYSPGLAYEVRLAHERRQLTLDLLAEDREEPPRFTLSTTLSSDVEGAAKAIREALGIGYRTQTNWRDSRVAFHAWRGGIEDLGVLVFQASRVESEEASGFAFYAPSLPFVVVNRKDAWERRVFSLMHELAHLMLNQSGVSDLDTDGRRPPSDQRVEVFCNQVAAAALMPKDAFLSEAILQGVGTEPREWSDDTIRALSATYSVSREAVVRRLLTFGRTTEDFYRRKRAEYAREFAARKQREREQQANKTIARNMPRETVADAGRPFVRMLLSHYHANRLSLAELSGFLGVKARHVSGIEQTLGLA